MIRKWNFWKAADAPDLEKARFLVLGHYRSHSGCWAQLACVLRASKHSLKGRFSTKKGVGDSEVDFWKAVDATDPEKNNFVSPTSRKESFWLLG